MLQKNLKKQGINYYGLNTLQKLSIVGSSGMGALCYVPDNKITTSQDIVDLDAVQQAAAGHRGRANCGLASAKSQDFFVGRSVGNGMQVFVSTGGDVHFDGAHATCRLSALCAGVGVYVAVCQLIVLHAPAVGRPRGRLSDVGIGPGHDGQRGYLRGSAGQIT